MSHGTHGSFVPLVSQGGKGDTVGQFLVGGYGIVLDEPDTLQWYATKYVDSNPEQFAIFDTFPHEEGRGAHFSGAIPAALMEHAPNMLSEGPDINKIMVEVLASKVTKVAEGQKAGLTVGIRVLFTAKPEKKEAVKTFLTGSLPLIKGEANTAAWYAIHFHGTDNFGIVAFFASEEAKEAHLKDKVATAFLSSADENLVGAPDLVKLEVLAAKVIA
ncbi:hypothetical protein M413DRAFT_273572 [Hebeloma cylindrosporum]|uniref:ABM domain-containing protein n=1 Tax=Hebeloma cylindrosporum TaxID=76867 RepID=A0A0C2XHN6_HEBCY|nr:hypothetical protein M413DRAFT_273572 [Hebeloma cylindrosporum h7]